MFYTKKIPVYFNKSESLILDGQSKICNWLYNHLLELAKEDYFNNDNKLKLLTGYNLRNYAVNLKQEKPFLKTVYSSVIKNTALRLKETFTRCFKEGTYPNFKSWNKDWFSLYYEETKGWKIEGNDLIISLGKDKTHQIKVKGKLKYITNDKFKTFRLVKQKNKFYAILLAEVKDTPKTNISNWISIDPNHKNTFTAINSNGKTFELSRVNIDKYFDERIDKLKSKRDKQTKTKVIKTENSQFKVHSSRWTRLNKAIQRLQNRRNEQIKTLLFTIANSLYRDYDLVLIGDYTPDLNVAKYKRMHRSMLNQSHIGSLRKALKRVSDRLGKHLIIVDEYHTTKENCLTGELKSKDPSVREFYSGEKLINRDINSSVNIAKKLGYYIVNLKDLDLSKPSKVINYRLGRGLSFSV